MADGGAMQPVRRPLRVVRIKNENESVANVQRIMQGPTYQEKERRAATWNAAGCGSGLSESDMELVRDQSRPKDRCLAEINECVLTGDAHGTFKAAAVVGSKITNMVVKLIGSHEHMNRPSACYGIRSWIGCDCRSPSSRFPAASENEVNPFAVRDAISY